VKTTTYTTAILALTLAALAALLASCAVGPDYQRPDAAPTPAAYKSAQPAAPAALSSPVGGVNAASSESLSSGSVVVYNAWWTLFNDPALAALITDALAANPSLEAAMARVDQARALLKAARADYFPSLSLNPGASRGRSSPSHLTNNNFTLPLDLSYEVDIWGKLRRANEAQRASALATAADYEVVRQTMLAELAQDYFNLNLYDEQATILAESADIYRRQLDLTQTKQRAGIAFLSDVLYAQTQLDGVLRQQVEAQRARDKTEHAIAILIGKTPDQLTLPAKRIPTTSATAPATGNATTLTAFVATIPAIPAGLPSTLLARRPDVAEAEQTLISANANIGVAKAQLYPSLNLSGALGYQNNDLSGLTDWSNRIWSIAGGITAPLFQGGKLRANVEQAQAAYHLQLANYRAAVLNAFGDVEDSLTDLHYLADEARMLDQTVKNAAEDVRLTDLQYRQGLVSNLDVITSVQSLLTARMNAAQVTQQRLSASVLLIKALGGGWNPEDMPALLKTK